MAALGRSERLLSRLERIVDGAVASREHCILAFSGGLGSLVVGSVARKRTDLRCVVVDAEAGPDLEAATLAERYLDFRVRVLRVRPTQALALARRLAAGHPRWDPAKILAAVPVRLVVDREPRAEVLVGTRPDRRRSEAIAAPETRRLRLPLVELAGPRSLARTDLRALGRLLGIPEPFLRVPARSPSEGSGLGPALRTLARERGTTVARLLHR